MLAVASAGVDGYRTTQELLGLQPVHGNRFATLTARLRRHGVLDRSRPRSANSPASSTSTAPRSTTPACGGCAACRKPSWTPPAGAASRHLLTRPDTWAHCRHASHAELPAAPIQEHLARLRLIELLTGTHPATYPGRCGCPDRDRQDYAKFVFTLPEPLARFLDHRARFLLRHAGIDEPLSWEPPFGWVTGITWPGPHPGDIDPGDLHPLVRSDFPSASPPPGSAPSPTTSRWSPHATRRHHGDR